ncbi:TonB-dependent siderophore receptor [Pelomonas sp. KK5]|uniref:TonB-dependent receptor n=1 Tax=Pelomonas sp. KK5 TaxID=1855730 RepID=UPI00097CBE58|nr:TonB-dependent receptor [Pelomonas sp. KK5]
MSRKHKKTTPARHALLPLGALAAGFGLASAALAQTAAPAAADAKDDQALPVVRVKAAAEQQGKEAYLATETRIGKGKQDIRDIPQAVTIITEKLLDDRNFDNVKEVLRNTSGITFQAAEGGEEDIKIHGISLQGTGDVFIDGMRDPAFYDRDTFFLDRIELLRGSGALMFGRGSTGGALNQQTKKAILADQNQIDVTLSSHSGLRSVGDFNKRTGETSALRVGLMKDDADSDGAGNKVDKIGAGGSFRYGIGEEDEFGVTAYVLDNNNGINYGMPWIKPTSASATSTSTLVPVDPNNYYGMASDFNKGGIKYLMLDHTHRFSSDVELVTKVRYADYYRDMRASLIRLATGTGLDNLGPNTVLSRNLQIKKQDMQTLTAQSDLQAKVKIAGFENTILTGVDFAREAKQVYAAYSAAQGGVVPAKPSTTLGTPYDGASSNESLRSFRTSSDYVSKGLGAYLQDMVQVAPMWKVVAGLRYDKVDGDYNGYTIPNNAQGPVTTTPYQMRISEWSKRAAVLFQPSDSLSFHLMGATAFNTSGDAYSLGAANAAIPPEKSVNVELGAKIDSFDGKLSTQIGIFRNTKLHERNTDPLTNLVELSGKRHAAGVDVNVIGRITPQWEVFATATWMPVAKIDIGVPGAEGQGTRPSLTPRYSGNFWTTYQFTPALRLGTGANARSGQQPNRNPGFYAPKFVIFNLMGEYAAVPDTLLFRVNIDNVANKRYADALYTAFYVPGTGRIVSLTGTYKF